MPEKLKQISMVCRLPSGRVPFPDAGEQDIMIMYSSSKNRNHVLMLNICSNSRSSYRGGGLAEEVFEK